MTYKILYKPKGNKSNTLRSAKGHEAFPSTLDESKTFVYILMIMMMTNFSRGRIVIMAVELSPAAITIMKTGGLIIETRAWWTCLTPKECTRHVHTVFLARYSYYYFHKYKSFVN